MLAISPERCQMSPLLFPFTLSCGKRTQTLSFSIYLLSPLSPSHSHTHTHTHSLYGHPFLSIRRTSTISRSATHNNCFVSTAASISNQKHFTLGLPSRDHSLFSLNSSFFSFHLFSSLISHSLLPSLPFPFLLRTTPLPNTLVLFSIHQRPA